MDDYASAWQRQMAALLRPETLRVLLQLEAGGRRRPEVLALLARCLAQRD